VVAAKSPTGTERTYEPPTGRNVIVRKSDAELHSPETRSTSYDGAMSEYRDDAMRILEKTKFAYGLADQERSADKVADLLDYHDSPDKEMARRVKFTSSPAYSSAFHKFITSRGQTLGFTAEEHVVRPSRSASTAPAVSPSRSPSTRRSSPSASTTVRSTRTGRSAGS
jgi:hypothetical protein